MIPPIMELLRHGVNVHLGCDNIYDCWFPYGMVHYKEKLARLGNVFNVKDQDALTQLLGLVTDSVTTLDEQGQANWPQVGAEATYLLTEAECGGGFCRSSDTGGNQCGKRNHTLSKIKKEARFLASFFVMLIASSTSYPIAQIK